MAVSASLRSEITALLDRMPDRNLRVLRDVLRRLDTQAPLRRWSPAIGCLSASETKEMAREIEEGCEAT